MKEFLRNDFQFLRNWLTVWGILLLLPVLCFAALRTKLGWDPDYWNAIAVGLPLLIILQMVVAILLIAMLVQKESPSNPRAYWLTRPVSRQSLPFLKLIGVAGFIVLPVLVQAALLGYLFPGGGDAVGAGVVDMGILVCLLILFSLPGAAMTRNSGQALLVCMGVPITVAILDMFVLKWIRIPIQTGLQNQLPPGFPLNALLFWLLALGVVAGYLRCVRYAPGGRRRWMNFVPAGLILLLGVNMPPSAKSVPVSTMRMPAGASLAVDSPTFKRRQQRKSGGTSTDVSKEKDVWMEGGPLSEYGLSGKAGWSGLPEEWLVIPEPIRSIDPKGTVLNAGETRRFSVPFEFLSLSYKHSLFPGYSAEGRTVYVGGRSTLFSSSQIKPEDLEWPAEFSTVFASRVYESEKVQVPFSQGARWSLDGRRIVVDRIEHMSDKVTLHVRYLERGGKDLQEKFPFPGGLFVLHHPESGDVSFGRQGSGSSSNFHKLLTVGRSEINFDRFPVSAEEIHQIDCYYIRHHLIGTDLRTVSYKVGTGAGENE